MKLFKLVTACALSLFVGQAALAAEKPIKIGFPIPLTGEIPKVGEGSKFAAEMLKEEINAKGGLKVGDKYYPLEFIYEDNESKPESAVNVTLKLIARDKVHAIVGPQSSRQAVPAGGVAGGVPAGGAAGGCPGGCVPVAALGARCMRPETPPIGKESTPSCTPCPATPS